jgi:hypothetical protein
VRNHAQKWHNKIIQIIQNLPSFFN